VLKRALEDTKYGIQWVKLSNYLDFADDIALLEDTGHRMAEITMRDKSRESQELLDYD